MRPAPMVHLQRFCRRSFLGPFLLGRCARSWLAAYPLAIALGCTPSAPPEAPAGAVEPSAPAAEDPLEAGPTEPAGDPSAPLEPDPAAESASPTAPSASARPPRDSRGKEEIQQVMANNRDKVRACYDTALAQNPGIKGDLVIDFTIDPRGDVKQAEVNWSQSEIHIPELDSCAADAVRSLKFPASSRGLESKVSYPFNFNPPRSNPPAQSPAGPDTPKK